MATWLIILFAICAFFTASEIIFTSADRIRLYAKSKSENKWLTSAWQFISEPYRFLGTVLIGTDATHIAIAILWGKVFENYTLSGIIATIVATLTLLVFGDLLPKIIAHPFATRLAPYFAVIHRLLYFVFYPLIQFEYWLAQKLGLYAKRPGYETREDLFLVIQRLLTKPEARFLEKIVKLREKCAKDIMIPRHRIVAIPVTATIDEVIQKVRETGHYRYPVYDEQLDNIVGVLRIRKLFGSNKSIRSVLDAPLFLPDIITVWELWSKMEERGEDLAILIDEYGGVSGIVTVEDIVEELVGEIQDEFDYWSWETEIEELQPGTYRLPADMRLTEVEDKLGIKFPREVTEFETLYGIISHYLGTSPAAGSKVNLNGITLEVGRGIKQPFNVILRVEQAKKEE